MISRSASTSIPPVEGMRLVRVTDKAGGPDTAAWVRVAGAQDMERAAAAAGQGHSFVVVQPESWKIIPLENLIADFHRSGKRVYAYMKTKSEMETAFSILEKGVDGIVVPAEALEAAAGIVSTAREGRPLLPAGRQGYKDS